MSFKSRGLELHIFILTYTKSNGVRSGDDAGRSTNPAHPSFWKYSLVVLICTDWVIGQCFTLLKLDRIRWISWIFININLEQCYIIIGIQNAINETRAYMWSPTYPFQMLIFSGNRVCPSLNLYQHFWRLALWRSIRIYVPEFKIVQIGLHCCLIQPWSVHRNMSY